jgi:hypothetical protein
MRGYPILTVYPYSGTHRAVSNAAAIVHHNPLCNTDS